jgi:hypothetical protein
MQDAGDLQLARILLELVDPLAGNSKGTLLHRLREKLVYFGAGLNLCYKLRSCILFECLVVHLIIINAD